MALATLIALAAVQAAAPPPAPAPDQLAVILYRQGPGWIAGEPMERQKLRDHFPYMRTLQRDGILIGGGPFAGENAGMALVRASSPAAAQAIVAADPAVVAGVFTATVKSWRIAVGTRTLPPR